MAPESGDRYAFGPEYSERQVFEHDQSSQINRLNRENWTPESRATQRHAGTREPESNTKSNVVLLTPSEEVNLRLQRDESETTMEGLP